MKRIIKLSDIIINETFSTSMPRLVKMQECRDYWNRYHEQDRYIIVNRNNILIDGYVQYLVLKENGIEDVEIKICNSRSSRWFRKSSNKYEEPKYKNSLTTYVYGSHPKDVRQKQYMWRVPEKWRDWANELQIGDKIICETKYGVSPVIIEKIERLDKCPNDDVVRKVHSKKIIKAKNKN